MISIQQVERALSTIGSYDERRAELTLKAADPHLLVILRQREWLEDARRRAREVIRQAQMERAWPMLGHLDIYSWPK